VNDIVWLPGGRDLVLAAGRDPAQTRSQLWLLSFPGGKARRITNDLNAYYSVSPAADGRSLAAIQSSSVSNLWAVPANDPARARALTNATSPELSPFDVASGPAGSVLYSLYDDRGSRIVSLPPAGGAPRTLFSTPFFAFGPRYAAAESTIAFTATRDGRSLHVWRMGANGGDAAPVTSGDGEFLSDISPDGRWVYFSRMFDWTLWRAPTAGGDARRANDTTTIAARFSPDGRSLLCLRWTRTGDQGELSLAIVPASGGAPTWTLAAPPVERTDGNILIEWTPDGRALSYPRNTGTVGNIWLQALDRSPPRQLTRFDDLRVGSHAWSPDGRTLYAVRGRYVSDVVLIRDFR
jgi:Tol biopolymer transport system component